ncbi:hypothetical protein DICPUDRAFT_84050 [Dictyostelium purpureum]|uniref:Uncharacterized protein n=1 Tax=Dictyostelium purpureum TaxID=5786 RepID=F1A1F7_DICPU|nr:uncharacterized protein DICPUDRAFT_84050 [Dictyostelium purpureum]EGC29971.1 hypothetical protein DICPUDRAFT_84050 [Dictyostelium purpureum]|eukprot:XP_003293510.1 hypothetical protein DICPUDRAFT_84050 [Dictyostelium purpureum]
MSSNSGILNNNSNNKNKIVRVSIRSKQDIIKEFSTGYPTILENYIDKDEYLDVIKKLNGYDGVLNKKAITACIVILLIGIVCCVLGGISNMLLNKDNNNSGSTGDQPPSVVASQIVFFSVGGVSLINSIVFLIFIYKVPFKNVKTIRKTLSRYNQKFLSRKIEFSLECENDEYFMKISIPSNPLPYSDSKNRYNEKTSLLKQPANKRFKQVLIFDPS